MIIVLILLVLFLSIGFVWALALFCAELLREFDRVIFITIPVALFGWFAFVFLLNLAISYIPIEYSWPPRDDFADHVFIGWVYTGWIAFIGGPIALFISIGQIMNARKAT